MGKFLRDDKGLMVAVDGAPVLEKKLDRKPRDCEGCGFDRWIRGDKLFIIKGNEWLCPDCAVQQGLPTDFYIRNHFATAPLPDALVTPEVPEKSRSTNISGIGDLFACMCYF
jgi:hypothetical protein